MELLEYLWDKKTASLFKKLTETISIVDCHAHIGVDDDGIIISDEDLVSKFTSSKITASVVFPFSDPDRGEDYHKPNERILDAVKKYPDKLIPFFRLDPNKDWEEEFKLRVEQGFVGVKLHPSRQKFNIACREAMKIYKLAVENNLVVLIHTGLGMVKISSDVKKVLEKVPNLKLILGHSAFVEMDKTIEVTKKYPNVYFDTSTIRVFDMYQLLREIPTKRILFGSDYPYYNHPLSLEIVIDTALSSKKSFKALQEMFGLNLLSILKESEIFAKSKLKKELKKGNENSKEFNEQFKQEFLKIINFPIDSVKGILDVFLGQQKQVYFQRILGYLRIYSLLNSAEVVFNKSTGSRFFNRLNILTNITESAFNRGEEKHLKVIYSIVDKLLDDKKKIMKGLKANDHHREMAVRTQISIAKNICLLRMLKF